MNGPEKILTIFLPWYKQNWGKGKQ